MKKIGEVILGLLICFIAWAFLFNNNSKVVVVSTTGSTKSSSCHITKSKFEQIKTGMTYSQVKEVVGCPGELVSESEVMDSKATMYVWYGSDGVSNANIIISDGKVLSKAQSGL